MLQARYDRSIACFMWEDKEMKDFKQLLQESTDAIERQIEELRKERAEFKEYLKTLQAKADKVPRVEQ